MTQKPWFFQANDLIAAQLVEFYEHFLPDTHLEQVGSNLRLETCPKCGHRNCATITPNTPFFNCFSPGCVTGTNLSFLQQIYPEDVDLLTKVGEFLKLPYIPREVSPEEVQEGRSKKIRTLAADHYHKHLVTTPDALEYQLRTRGHSLELLRTFNVGFSGDFRDLNVSLLSQGFTKEEIKAAKVWFPTGLFIYPYLDPHTKEILRFNTKNPFKAEYEGKVIEGFSTGNKSFMTTPTLDKEYVVLEEGENDLITSFDMGATSIIAIGGRLSKEQLGILARVLERFERIYLCFDNDDAGRAYEKEISDLFPDKPIFRIDFGTEVNDIDEAYRRGGLRTPFHELIALAPEVESEGARISHVKSKWSIANRKQKMVFELLEKGRNGDLLGTIQFFEQGTLVDMAYDRPLQKYTKGKPLNYALIQAMEEHFNEHIESKTIEELVEIYFYSKWPNLIVKRLSEILHALPDDEREPLIEFLQAKLNAEIADIILKELNNMQNAEIEDYSAIPKMQIGQFFSPKENDAFFYYTFIRADQGTVRKLPYLLANDRKLIRLDLLKRKDPQCLLLIRNKYELPIEVPQALFEMQNTSLAQNWVDKWVNDEIDARELEPALLIRRIEAFTRRFYYFSDDETYKVLALWIFGTYAYQLFGQYPYLFLCGKKGSGKTILDTTLELICFNPKMAVSISPPALFRSVAIEGGTHILDEMENMGNRDKNKDSDMAAILKGGYSRSGKAIRCDKDNGNIPVSFEVYGPKVISNIFGIDDIISDRCLPVNTLEVPKEIRGRLEDPKELFTEGLGEVRELTSKCAISVLTHFQHIYKVYRENVFYVANARLSQIMKPILALASIAGPSYETALHNYYTKNIVVSKEETEYATPEGALADILKDICLEVIGVNPPNYLNAVGHKYRNEIKFDLTEGYFELDALHVKTFMEEVMAGEKIETRNVSTWIRRVSLVDMNNRKKRTTVPIEDESLMREYNGNTRIKVVVHKFMLTDFFDTVEIAKMRGGVVPPPPVKEVTFEDF